MARNSKTYISINSHVIRSNAKHGQNKPPIRIAKSRNDRAPVYAHSISIDGPSNLVYNPHNKLLNCGARLVLETEHVVTIKKETRL